MIKNFRIRVILRVLLLAATLLLTMYLILETTYVVSTIVLSLAAVAQIILLIHFLEQTNIQLTRFLEAIRYSDFTGTFRDKGLGQSFGELNEAFGQVIDSFKVERNKKEESLRYLETVVQHIGIGLICFNSKGEVVLLNSAAKRLFQISTLRRLDSLKSISESLFNSVQNLKSGGRSLVRITVKNEAMQLAIYATEFRMRDEQFKLVSFHNIHTELEEKEMESWQNLTQVLAHEIMNSITPIASLSGTVNMLLEDDSISREESYVLDAETLEDVKEALTTIGNRSEGLMRFVNSYREFTQIPEPNYEVLKVNEVLKRVCSLMKAEAQKEHIELAVQVEPESLEVTADSHLVEQVLINLVKNAIRILTDQQEGLIMLRGLMDSNGKVVIQVQDNGPGIKKSVSEKIFIPFYSISANPDKKGSGIGLSLSRQIMRLHNGTLSLNSEPGKGSVFVLRF